MIKNTKAGFSLIELLIGLGLASLLSAVAYRYASQANLKNTQTLTEMRTSQEINKVMDRITSEIENAFSLGGSQTSFLGGIANTPNTNCPVFPRNSPFIPPSLIIPHGLVALPGRAIQDIDQNNELTLVNPSDPNPFTSSTESEAADAIRIAYIPLYSKPVTTVGFTVYNGKASLKVPYLVGLDVSKLFHHGDFIIVSDPTRREIFRVTQVDGLPTTEHYLEIDYAKSYWNKNILCFFPNNPLSPDTECEPFNNDQMTVQTIQLSTYALDPETHLLYRDDHVKDDGFDPTTNSFNQPQKRVPNWQVVAKNIETFHVKYEVLDSTASNSPTSMKQYPQVSYPAINCINQLGYPLFKNAIIEMSLLGSASSPASRRATSKNLTKGAGSGDESLDKDEVVLAGSPTPTPGLGPPLPVITVTPKGAF